MCSGVDEGDGDGDGSGALIVHGAAHKGLKSPKRFTNLPMIEVFIFIRFQ